MKHWYSGVSALPSLQTVCNIFSPSSSYKQILNLSNLTKPQEPVMYIWVHVLGSPTSYFHNNNISHLSFVLKRYSSAQQKLNHYYMQGRASLMAQTVKNLSATWETWVQSLGWKDPLGKEMATHSGILAWRIPQTEELAGYSQTRCHKVRHDWATEHSTSLRKQMNLMNITSHERCKMSLGVRATRRGRAVAGQKGSVGHCSLSQSSSLQEHIRF